MLKSKLNSYVMPNSEEIDPSASSSSFYFQQRRGSLDIRSISKANIEKIVNDVDIDTLQSILENITFCALTEKDLRYLTDPMLLKLFRLSQLAIEYLLYVQEELMMNVSNAAKKYASKKRELIQKRQELAVMKESVDHLQRQVKAKRDNITVLETLLKQATSKRPKRVIHHHINEIR